MKILFYELSIFIHFFKLYIFILFMSFVYNQLVVIGVDPTLCTHFFSLYFVLSLFYHIFIHCPIKTLLIQVVIELMLLSLGVTSQFFQALVQPSLPGALFHLAIGTLHAPDFPPVYLLCPFQSPLPDQLPPQSWGAFLSQPTCAP